MSLINDIIRSEIIFPRRFAEVEERNYGILYHTTEIPDSYDGNHACILHPDDCTLAVRDMEDFYRTRGLSPRVYHISFQGEGRELRAALIACGFQFGDQTNQFYVHASPSRLTPRGDLSIRRVRSPSPELLEMIGSHSLREMKVVRRSLACPDFHLLVGFLQGQPVTMAAVERAGAVARVDSVLTPEAHRGKGYARAVIHELVGYHARVLGGTLCLYTDNPTAARIYEAAGFEKLVAPLDVWSAWKD